MSSPGNPLDPILGRYQQELVRWNRQINLVSRQDTLRRIALLIGQCRRAWLLLAGSEELAAWPDAAPVSYFDLGSGGGLPGFVWHLTLSERFASTETILVEPREKRAWFLERLQGLAPERPFQVWNARWGDAGSGAPGQVGNTLISLKALHLTDREVLQGLVEAVSGLSVEEERRVTIARFYPSGQKWNRALKEELAPLAEPTRLGELEFKPCGSRILSPSAPAPEEAALVLSSYLVEENSG